MTIIPAGGVIRDREPMMKMTEVKKNKEPWIGLVHVRPSGAENALGGDRKGAYVNTVALADSPADFLRLVEDSLRPDGLIVIEIEDLDKVDKYRSEGRIDEHMDYLIGQLGPEWMVLFDDFHTYGNDDA